MSRWTALLAALAFLALNGCGESGAAKPLPASEVTLTPAEQEVWAKLPPDRSAIPVVVYHGIGPESDFSNSEDAAYGIDAQDFATQMTEIRHAGYQTVGLQTFLDFISGKPVDLPPRPLLLTFDDGRTDSWTGADGILRQLHFNAVMFVDVGRVDHGDPEYLSWEELRTAQDSGRWELQLHSGQGHMMVRYGPAPDETGAYYAYEERREDFDAWRRRVRADIEWGQKTLAEQIPAYRPRAFAPPYGNYGQDGTNDERIPGDLLGWLTERYRAVFTQDRNALARAGSAQPLGRIQVTRKTTGGELHAMLLSGEN
jgi:biofilm PGA synthesis lipoprotein PgaB